MAQRDLYAELDQSACDKVLGSVKYPFAVVDQNQPFPGCSRAASPSPAFYAYHPEEIRKLLKDAVDFIRAEKGHTELTLHDQIYSFGGSILEQTKKVLDALTNGGDRYSGPSKVDLEHILDKGIEGLVDTLGDFGFYAWCPHLKVSLRTEPRLLLSSPRIDVKGLRVEAEATGELWAKYPWWNCYKWCLKWEKVIKCERIASVSPRLDVAADAHANFQVNGVEVVCRAEFDRLRLDYPILDKIPLEAVANLFLKNKTIPVYDASKLVQTIPIFGSKFGVDCIELPPLSEALGVAVVVKQSP
jgi:hypothetical protein